MLITKVDVTNFIDLRISQIVSDQLTCYQATSSTEIFQSCLFPSMWIWRLVKALGEASSPDYTQVKKSHSLAKNKVVCLASLPWLSPAFVWSPQNSREP